MTYPNKQMKSEAVLLGKTIRAEKISWIQSYKVGI